MSISQSLVPEFDMEMATTRRVLERVPEAQMAWKPHEKSMSLGRLAGHVAEMVGWATETVKTDGIDFGTADMKPLDPATTAELLAAFDQHVSDARAALSGVSDAALGETWSLKMNGQTLFANPKIVVLRGMVMNHVIHHRGQLSVYLRMLDVKIPSIYGPSGDDAGAFAQPA